MSELDGAIVGLGLSAQGRHLGVSARELRRQALEAALADAGLTRRDIDACISIGSDTPDLRYLGLSPGMAFTVNAGGASPAMAIIAAAGAVATGQAETIACVYGEAWTSRPDPLVPHNDLGDGYDIKSFSYGYPFVFGLVGPGSVYALAARRHMSLYGLTSEQLGAVAVTERDYAAVRPGTQGFGSPITIEDHQRSRMVVDPLRLLDCSRPTDGGAVVIVTSRARAADLRQPPVPILGAGTAQAIEKWWTGEMFESMNCSRSARRAFRQAGITIDDVDVAQLYAPFTIAVVMQLEEYGFCGTGEGGAFVEDGQTRIDGRIPVNTGGGQLSGFYATGFTPISEGVLQMRGKAPTSQLPGAEICVVSGSGGNVGIQGSWAHATLVLGASR